MYSNSSTATKIIWHQPLACKGHSSVELCISNVADAHANSFHFLGTIHIKCINPLELFREQ